MADVLKTSDIEAPEENVFLWNFLVVDGRQVPGQCLPIEFERERECDQPKKKGSSVNVLYDQGLKPSEVTVRIRTIGGEQLRELQDFYLRYMDPERPLAKRTVNIVAHPQLYARGVKAGYFFAASSPMPTREGGIWPLITTFKFKIVDPKTKISTAGGSSKPKLKDVTVGGQISSLLPATVAAFSVPGISIGSIQAPAVQAAVILNPPDLRKSAQTGNGLARLVTNIVDGAAPP